MKTQWDYTELADAYLKRPDYSADAITAMLKIAGVSEGGSLCDVGAGVGHLTKMLAQVPNAKIVAVEPNDAMRANGMRQTAAFSNVTWVEGTGEATGCTGGGFDLVTFGSSFNVTDRSATLKETARILKPHGWFGCMWNHRDLTDPIQAKIESIIQSHVPEYSYGTRREDQVSVIAASHLFGAVLKIEGTVDHTQPLEECIEAWYSHATLHRQAGPKFQLILRDIEQYLRGLGQENIIVPFATRIFISQLK